MTLLLDAQKIIPVSWLLTFCWRLRYNAPFPGQGIG
jgi:hypothetical protein